MKATSTEFDAKRAAGTPLEVIKTLHIFFQHAGEILSITGDIQFHVSGRATPLMRNSGPGDSVIISTHKASQIYPMWTGANATEGRTETTLYYNNGEGPLVAGDVGARVAYGWDVTDMLTEGGLSHPQIRVEGDRFNQFASGSLSFTLDDPDGDLYDAVNQTGPLYMFGSRGTATSNPVDSSQTSYIDDSGAAWTVDSLYPGELLFLSGACRGKRYHIYDNTATRVSVRGNMLADGALSGDDFTIIKNRLTYFVLQAQVEDTPDSFVVMSGVIEPSKIKFDVANKRINLIGYGLLKELEYVPAYEVADESGQLARLTGIVPVRYVAPSEGVPIFGPRRLQYRFGEQTLSGVRPIEMSADTANGNYQLQYKPHQLWRWARGLAGAFETKSSDGESTLTAHADVAGTIKCDFQTGSYPLQETSDMMVVAAGGTKRIVWSRERIRSKDFFSKEPQAEGPPLVIPTKFSAVPKHESQASELGHPYLTFDEGREISIMPFFDLVYFYDGTGATYTEHTIEAETIGGTSFEVADDSNDFFYLGSRVRPNGAHFILDPTTGYTGAAGTPAWTYYATDDTWKSLTVTDGTSDFTQDGTVYWDIPDDMAVKPDLGASGDRPLYWVRVGRSASESPAAKAYQITKYFEAVGARFDRLGFRVLFDRLEADDIDDDVVIIHDSSDNPVVATWYTNARLEDIVTRLLDQAQYGSTKRTITDLALTSSRQFIGMWGKFPNIGSRLRPTAWANDADDSQLIIAYENELWRIPYAGEALFIDKISDEYEIAYIGLNDLNSRINCLAIKRARPSVSLEPSEYPIAKDGLVFEIKTDFSGIDYVEELDSATNGIVDSRYIYRHGYNGGVHRTIGQLSGTNEGENVVVPWDQRLVHAVAQDEVGYRSLLSLWLDNTPTREDLISDVGAGWIRVGSDNSTDEVGLRVDIGSLKGYTNMLLSEVMLCEMRTTTYPNEAGIYSTSASSGGLTVAAKTLFQNEDIHTQVMFQGPDLGSVNTVFLAHTHWIDRGTSPANRESDCIIDILHNDGTAGHDPNYIMKFDASVLTDDTASSPHVIPKDFGDYIAVGFETKFCDLYWDISTAVTGSPTYVLEYYDGAAWQLIDVKNDETSDFTNTNEKQHWFDHIRDADESNLWTKSTPAGFPASKYWIRARCTIAGDTDGDYNDVWAKRVALWDSEDAGADRGKTVIDMEYNTNEERLYLCLLDKETLEYHVAVLDLDFSTHYPARTAAATLYKTQTGFENNHPVTGMVYQSADNKIYAVESDPRFQDADAKLLSMTSSGSTITIVEESPGIWPGESWLPLPLLADATNERVLGITGNREYMLWQYGDSYDVRIAEARFEQADSVRKGIELAAQVVGGMPHIKSEGDLIIKARENSDAATTIGPEGISAIANPSIWPHMYDAVTVRWTNHRGESGSETWGQTGFNRRVFTVNNPFIDNRHLANVVAEKIWRFVSGSRRIVPIEDHCGVYLEMFDALSVAVSESLADIKSADGDRMVIGLDIDMDTLKTQAALLEKF